MSILNTLQSGTIAIQNKSKYLDSLTTKYLLKPLSSLGIGGFVFDYEDTSTVDLVAEITDHYAEDNSSINDHIAIKPIKIILKGFVAELSVINSQNKLAPLQNLSNKLNEVSAYLGDYTPGVLQKLNDVLAKKSSDKLIDNVLSTSDSLVQLFSRAIATPNKQQIAYRQLESLFLTKQIFTVQTPYKFFDSMAIESLSFSQDGDTKMISDITVTLKQLRFIDVQFSQLTEAQMELRNQIQKSAAVGPGVTPTAPLPNNKTAIAAAFGITENQVIIK